MTPETSFATEDVAFYGYMGINKCNYLYFGTAVQQWGRQHSAFHYACEVLLMNLWVEIMFITLDAIIPKSSVLFFWNRCVQDYLSLQECHPGLADCIQITCQFFFPHIIKLFEGWLMEDCLEKHWSYTNRCWDTSWKCKWRDPGI